MGGLGDEVGWLGERTFKRSGSKRGTVPVSVTMRFLDRIGIWVCIRVWVVMVVVGVRGMIPDMGRIDPYLYQ